MLNYYLTEGLKKLNQKATREELGDRTQYIGSSDVTGCLRKTVMEKRHPIEPDLTTLIRFQRGHMVEKMLKDALDAVGYRYEYQHEACHPEAPLKAHIDFLFHGTNKTEAILECKSVTGIPSIPYENWITQLHYQMGLLALEKPDSVVRGAIFAVDINTCDRKIFNGYHFDPFIFGGLVKKAENIWDCVCSDADDQKLRTEKGPLCAWCHNRPGCPAFELNEDIPEVPIEEDVLNYLSLKETEKCLEKEIKELAETIKAAIRRNSDNGKIRAGDSIATLSKRSRANVNEVLLKKDNPDIHKKYNKTSSYEVLRIN